MGVYMQMTAVSVEAYLGIILAGCVAVSIADSFSTPQIRTRCGMLRAARCALPIAFALPLQSTTRTRCLRPCMSQD